MYPATIYISKKKREKKKSKLISDSDDDTREKFQHWETSMCLKPRTIQQNSWKINVLHMYCFLMSENLSAEEEKKVNNFWIWDL